jgi:hypothetical protein
MTFLPTTHFRVLTPTPEFPRDFQVTKVLGSVIEVANSDNETYVLSPLVVAQRLRENKIQVIAYPWHPSHVHKAEYREESNRWYADDQCSRCLVRINEEQIQFSCPYGVVDAVS